MVDKNFSHILSSKRNGTLYIGVTNDIIRCIFEHKSKLMEGFSKTYHITDLVYFGMQHTPEEANKAEKRLKRCSIREKITNIGEYISY